MLLPEIIRDRFTRWAKGVLAVSADNRRLRVIDIEARDSHFAAHFIF
jgi:hypothetical protein